MRKRDVMTDADIILRVFDAPADITPAQNEIVVINKSDLHGAAPRGAICVSAKTGDGIDALTAQIARRMHAITDGADADVVLNARTKTLLADAAENLSAALTTGDNWDIFAEYTRRAADDIGRILGTITATDVMDATFGQLCLGK